MMASHCNSQFLYPRFSHWLLALVLTMMWHFSVTESATPIQLRGEIGGNVTFRCPVVKQKTIKFFYFQKGNVYVNGYYATKESKGIQTWKNSRLDREKTTVHMDSLNISHSGDYQCHIMYNDSQIYFETVIHLSLTANYSKPEATSDCRDGLSCLVTCASHGGYPGTKMTWNVTGSQMWRVENNSIKSEPDTMMVNSSSTAYFNCSKGEWKFSCSVGEVTSDVFRVCTPKDPPKKDTFSPYVIIASVICAVVVLSSIIMVVLWRKFTKEITGARRTDLEQEGRVNGELTSLNTYTNNEGEEAF